MPLQPVQPITTPGQSYDKFWLAHLDIQAPMVGQDASLFATLKPFNSQTGDVAPPELWVRIDRTNLLAQINGGNMTLAQAYGAILNAVQQMYNEQVS